ncbi:MAG: hypothetical protein V3T83_19365 [Acidobacteriota bacterium]
MKAITLRNLPPHVEQVVRRRAAEERWSLNRTVVRMLEEAVSSRFEEEDEILEELAGTWSEEEAKEFDQALKAQRAIDPEIWKE